MTYLFEEEIEEISNRRYYNNIGFETFFNTIKPKVGYILGVNLLRKDIITIFEKNGDLIASYSIFRTKMEEYGDIIYMIPKDCYE